MSQKNRIDPCDAVICSHKVAMGIEVEKVTTNENVEAYFPICLLIKLKGTMSHIFAFNC